MDLLTSFLPIYECVILKLLGITQKTVRMEGKVIATDMKASYPIGSWCGG